MSDGGDSIEPEDMARAEQERLDDEQRQWLEESRVHALDITKTLLSANFAAQLTKPQTHTPSEREEIALQVNIAMLETFDALQSYVLLRDLKETIDVAMGKLKDRAMAKMEGKDMPVFRAVVNTQKLPRQFDYTEDAEWVSLDGKKKAREALLKSLKEPMTTVNEKTGETTVVKPAKVKSGGGETLNISFPKG